MKKDTFPSSQASNAQYTSGTAMARKGAGIEPQFASFEFKNMIPCGVLQQELRVCRPYT